MNEYRLVRVAGDESVHYAAAGADRTIGCGRAVAAELVIARNDRPRCGPCMARWLAATGQPPMFVWASFGPDSPPDRMRVESCIDCAALVPAETFDVHGQWHARTARRGDAHL